MKSFEWTLKILPNSEYISFLFHLSDFSIIFGHSIEFIGNDSDKNTFQMDLLLLILKKSSSLMSLSHMIKMKGKIRKKHETGNENENENDNVIDDFQKSK